jgi:hypothetical protein
MPIRTIDNLGVDSSSRYAEDRKKYDATQASEARLIPQKTEIDVTIPSYPSEWEKLFESGKRNLFWADFYPPTGYNEQSKRLFTHRIIPSFGLEEKQEAQTLKINTLVGELEKRDQQESKEEKKKRFVYAWEEERERKEKEREKKALLGLLSCIGSLDKTLIDINAKRNQYQKG